MKIILPEKNSALKVTLQTVYIGKSGTLILRKGERYSLCFIK